MKRTKNNPTMGMTQPEIQEYWIKRGEEKFGSKFTYDKVTGLSKKKDWCIVTCKKHGDFETVFSHFINSTHGCNACAEENVRSKKRISFEDFKDRFYALYPNSGYKILSRAFKGKQIKHEYVYIQDEFGICKMNAGAMLSGNNPPNIKSAVFKDYYARNKYQKVHKYSNLSFNNSKYIGALSTTKASCSKHGEITTKPNWLLNGIGCKKCFNDRRSSLMKSNTKKFIRKSVARFNTEKSIYDKVKYVSAKEKVLIKCKHHGYYEITPNDHLSGYGCMSCSIESPSYTKEGYISMAKGREAIFYVLRIKSETENFYKVGITFRSVEKRYENSKKMPYSYETVYEHKGEAGYIWELERDILREYRSEKYVPSIKFQGYTECLSHDVNIFTLIKRIETLKTEL